MGYCNKSKKCSDDGYYTPVFSGVGDDGTGTGFAPSGYAAVGILHNKLYVWDDKTFYVNPHQIEYVEENLY